jgi:DNA polymerase-3 subunit delta
MLGVEFGLLDQEVAKLALYTDAKGKITEALVHEVTGGWQAKTAWELVEAAATGNAAEALKQLNRLLSSGEHPAALFGPISWSLRRYAAATRLFQRSERQGRRISLSAALEEAGFQRWQRKEIQDAEKQLRRLGRERATRLYRWLLEADLALKGSHSSPEMSRWVMERLLMQMACPTSASR